MLAELHVSRNKPKVPASEPILCYNTWGLPDPYALSHILREQIPRLFASPRRICK